MVLNGFWILCTAGMLAVSAGTAAGRDIAPPKVGSPGPSTFCNPLNLDYRIQVEEPCRREAADPVCVLYQGTYFLFASKSDGYWWSPDFINWTLVTPLNLPLEAYAPAVLEYNDSLYFMASGAGKLFRSSDPKRADSWMPVGPVRRDTDPALFRDDDGRVYLYFGCSQGGPISVVELDPTNSFREIGQPVACLKGDEQKHGWEVQGNENRGGFYAGRIQTAPWIEGSWMTKHAGIYYLQYAAPGTQWSSYGDGAYCSKSPLGPFTYADYSPFSFKPTGFMTGAGHSCTFADRDGHWWHLATGVVSVNHIFERRLALFPVDFEKQGGVATRTYLGDLPQYCPGKNPKPERGNWTGWMLLSYGKRATASSSLADHPVSSAFDEDIKTWWSAESGGSNEWLEVDLGAPKTIHAIQTNFAEQDIRTRGRVSGFSQRYLIQGAVDGNRWDAIVDKSGNPRDVPHDYVELSWPVQSRYLRLVNMQTPGGGKFAIRDFRIFGKGGGRPPAAVANVSVMRNRLDRRRATVSWSTVPRSEGYIIRYGVRPDALNNQYEVRDVSMLNINSLNVGTSYFFSVEAFNDNGITPGRTFIPVR